MKKDYLLIYKAFFINKYEYFYLLKDIILLFPYIS